MRRYLVHRGECENHLRREGVYFSRAHPPSFLVSSNLATAECVLAVIAGAVSHRMFKARGGMVFGHRQFRKWLYQPLPAVSSITGGGRSLKFIEYR